MDTDSSAADTELNVVVSKLRDHVLYLRDLGLREIPATMGRVRSPRKTPSLSVPQGAAPRRTPTSSPSVSEKSHPDPASALKDLSAKTIGDCQRCTLSPTRTHIVFGVGSPRAELVFVGEAPGADEDKQGMPFVGRSGQLLTKIIEAMGLSRETVYIANIIKCRPPGNRNPTPEEISACEPFLITQLDIIRPKVICALGTFAAQTLLRTKEPISRLRGRWHEYHGIKLMPTFHPAYLLRNPAEKKTVWTDIQLIMADMGLKEKSRPA